MGFPEANSNDELRLPPCRPNCQLKVRQQWKIESVNNSQPVDGDSWILWSGLFEAMVYFLILLGFVTYCALPGTSF